MFGIGMQEVVLICAIALVVVGPKRLPEVARALGKGYAEFRRAFDEMKRNVESDIDASELRRSFLDLPPPPPVPPAAPPSESLLSVAPAAVELPYPEIVEAAPRPAEVAPAPGGASAAAGTTPAEAERDRG